MKRLRLLGPGLLAVLALAANSGCSAWRAGASPETPAPYSAQALSVASDSALLDAIERAHFRYFVEQSDPTTGLTRDRSTSDSPASTAATGFSLSAYVVAAERGYVSRQAAAAYTLKVLRTLSNAPQGPAAAGESGYRGLFYHFIDPVKATRRWTCELSTIDTALLMAGVQCAESYYDQPAESEIRTLADALYRRVDWAWALNGHQRLDLGWTPESGFMPYHYGGYNEGMIMLLLGLGSPTHPLPAGAWAAYTRSETPVESYGQRLIPFGPLFGHQYSQAWVDFKGIADANMRRLGWDYFENSRRAVLAQHAYAIADPLGFKAYGALDWGLSACDGPGEVKKAVGDRTLQFHGYLARAAADNLDDGTIAPTAAAASLPFAPELVLPTLEHWRQDRPELWGNEGFADAFNPTFDPSKPSGWVDPDRLGIDQGPIVLMTENYRTGLVWQVMRRNPYLRQGLERAGFSGGWLATAPH